VPRPRETLVLEAIREADPGVRLRALFDEHWPAYARWMRRADPLPVRHCVEQLRLHMPEIAPIFDTIHARVGGGDLAARFLTMYQPPRLVRACSQAVLGSGEPTLIRTYDYSPRLFDGVLLRSEWGGVATLAMTDCLWGALDGINDRGLAVALAFGGRNAAGPGFGAPLVVRYLLQTCATVAEAAEVLARVPVFMPYTFVVLDETGASITAMVGPDRPPRFDQCAASTNHQVEGDWPEYQAQTRSVERLRELDGVMARGPAPEEVLGAFLRPPVWRTDYARASGTLYAAAYRPRARDLALHWPGRTSRFSLDEFVETSLEVTLPADSDLRASP